MLRPRSVRSAALFSIYVLGCLGVVHAAAPTTLQWQTNLEDAKRIAAQTNRLVLVHFWAPSCKPCLELEKNVFSQPQVQQFIDARFVPIKINADDAPTTTKRYGISRLPTDLILTPGAQIVGRLGCPVAADAYMQQLLVAVSNPSNGPSGSMATPSGPGAPGLQQPSGYTQNSMMPATLAPPAYATQGGFAANPVTQPIASPAQIAGTPAPNSTPNVGYSGQWSAQKSNAAVEQAYSDNRYSEYFQRYPTAPSSPQSAPVNSYAVATPPANYAPATLAPTNSNFAGQYPEMNSAGYGPAGPQLALQTNAPPAAWATNAPPPGNAAPQLGLDGYSPVALVEQGKWQLGDRRFGAIHRGRTYLFMSPDEQQRFLANPDRYSPSASGDDVVMAVDYGQEVPGNRSFGLMYQNRMYLFSSDATLRTFMQNRDRYAAQVMQAENTGRTSFR